MSIGTDLTQGVADLVPTYNDSVAAQQLRCLRHGSLAQREIAAEVVTIDEDWLLRSCTFSTVADRYPNRYALPSDFWNARYMERVVNATTGSTERIHFIDHIQDKDVTTDRFETDASAVTSTGVPEGYLLGTDFLELHPISDAAYTIRFWFDKTLPDLTAAGTIKLPHVCFQALVYKTAVHELRYRNEPWGDMEALFEKALARAIGSLHQRSDDGPRTITYMGFSEEYT